ncbi:MAG TPA: CHAP domain-containing protein [Candidatus Limnocylindria bacterium]|nr:CHAP domain-containing protein [Candidatus Limnocylindria bacterium]
MTPFFLLKAMRSTKKEVAIVLVSMSVIMALPIAAVSTTTNLKVLAETPLKLFTGTASTNNTYDYGYCTFWAAQRRAETGHPIPNTWGDAHTWDDRSKTDGYLVDHLPAVGAIMESDAGIWGHVAYVEKVNPDGSWEVSEMNVKGWDILSSRTFSAAQAQDYKFIH